MVSLMTKAKRMIVGNTFSDFKRAGQKVERFYIVYRYGKFTMYFLSRSFAVVREMRDIVKNDVTA
jgi:hypothetical protein